MAVDSDWAYQGATITDPAGAGDSAWKFLPVTITPPHHPVGVFVGGVIRYVPILTWDGTVWR
jgi:hypothetical protein